MTYEYLFAILGILVVIGLMFYTYMANSPKQKTLDATIKTKQIKTKYDSLNTHDYLYYHYIYFLTEEGKTERFRVFSTDYERLNEGDKGKLTFKGGRYISFVKEGEEA